MKHLDFHLPAASTAPERADILFEGVNPAGLTIAVNGFYLELGGKPWLPIMGEFHYSRYPRENWEAELLKMKVGGIDIVATYIFWNHHEEDEGVFDWSGQRDLRSFLMLCHQHGFWVSLRLGPFCHGEVRNGGLPDWLYGRSFEARSNDPRYLDLVQRLYSEIGRQADGFMFKDGGPVIALQFENEFMDSAAPWETTQLPGLELTPKGSGGLEHMRSLREIAHEAGLTAPLLTATGWGKSPVAETEFLPLFGGYAFHSWAEGPQAPTDCYVFRDVPNTPHPKYDRSRVPFASCEMGGGIQVFYKNRPVVPPESVEAMQVVYLGKGTNLIGYYVYHGGSNPIGKTFLNEHRCPRISYDFQAPIREFGQLAESYHRLRRQFLFLQQWNSRLAPMRTVLPTDQPLVEPTDVDSIRAAIRQNVGEGFVFLNNFQDHLDLPEKGPFQITIDGPRGQITFPSEGGLSLKTGTAIVLPFHLDLDGVDLIYATAQPITRVMGDGEVCYFFHSIEGIAPEFLLSKDGVDRAFLATGRGEVRNTTDGWLARLESGSSTSLFIERNEHLPIRIVALTDNESLRFWRGPISGRERAVISEADLLFNNGSLEIISHGQRSACLRIYPNSDLRLASSMGASEATTEGPFSHHVLALPESNVDIRIERLGPARVLIRLGSNCLDSLDELLLRIECDGDIATAHHDGRLIHDHFCNGLRWELGLTRFLPRHEAAEVVLQVSPRQVSGGEAKIVAGAMANMELATSGQAIAAIGSIEVIPRRLVSVVTTATSV